MANKTSDIGGKYVTTVDLYAEVINKVVEHMRIDFDEAGVDSDVLHYVKTEWKHKLAESKCLDGIPRVPNNVNKTSAIDNADNVNNDQTNCIDSISLKNSNFLHHVENNNNNNKDDPNILPRLINPNAVHSNAVHSGNTNQNLQNKNARLGNSNNIRRINSNAVPRLITNTGLNVSHRLPPNNNINLNNIKINSSHVLQQLNSNNTLNALTGFHKITTMPRNINIMSYPMNSGINNVNNPKNTNEDIRNLNQNIPVKFKRHLDNTNQNIPIKSPRLDNMNNVCRINSNEVPYLINEVNSNLNNRNMTPRLITNIFSPRNNVNLNSITINTLQIPNNIKYISSLNNNVISPNLRQPLNNNTGKNKILNSNISLNNNINKGLTSPTVLQRLNLGTPVPRKNSLVSRRNQDGSSEVLFRIGGQTDGSWDDSDDEENEENVLEELDDLSDDSSAAGKEDSDPLNSDDDDVEHDIDENSIENFVACQYIKVVKNKSIWRAYFMFGIIHVDGKEEAFHQALGKEDSDPLNSVDDDVEHDIDENSIENFVACQYIKVVKNRSIWRAYFMFGIIHVDGKEEAFHQALGEVKF
ncbi:hypothetical protein HELRODRAFT_171152 [Helobdella robusta]|uniref:Uncharacterized protein n=1 Tax=Helobdella robusta TaxID=6412 RepID=T1F3V5_HELRO|nr:hypothetical protein HELRODRAFT_171152 [Helobdella robusta]ESO05514.1 hypothetical protein HELRODRAFT_171152 [Helobdella robusta]